MTFVLLIGLKLKKYNFCEEISGLEQGETTFQNTLKIAYFAIRFFYKLSIYVTERNIGKSTNSIGYSS